MPVSTVKGTLYTYPDNFRAAKILIAAHFSGADIKLADNFVFGETDKSKAFLAKFPSGKVPAFESADGLCLNESSAIAHYVADDQLRHGKSPVEAASILNWILFADTDLESAVTTYCFPVLGLTPASPDGQSRGEFMKCLLLLDRHLAKHTYLVGDQITLADICVASVLLLPLQFVTDAAARKPLANLVRWFTTLTSQDAVVKAIGDVKLCEKAPETAAPKHQEKKAEKPKQQPQPKAASKPKESEEDDLEKPVPSKDPFGHLPKGNWDMDDFKRFYSNNDESKSVPYFFEKFDKDNFSVWHCEYNYPDELVKDFMSCNLIRGMFQRLDKMRKHSFGSMCLFGADKDATISGVWVWRGQGLAFDLSEDLQIDSPSYTWTKLDFDSPAAKQKIEDYFKWQGTDHAGRKFNQGKIFK